MSIPTNNIIRSATRKTDEPLRILWMPMDGVFEHLLLKHLPHTFYVAHDKECEIWDTSLFPYSDNVYTLAAHNSFSLDIEFDAIVCNARMTQFDQARILSHTLHVPLVMLEHFLPLPQMKVEDIHITKREKSADIEITVNEIVTNTWDLNSVSTCIPHGIPDLYDPDVEKIDQVLLAGKFSPEDCQQIHGMVVESPYPIKVIGDNPGLSVAATNEELVTEMQRSKFYLNVESDKTMPTTMLMAMSAGCVPISNRSPFVSSVVTELTLNNEGTSLPNGICYTSKREMMVCLDKFTSKINHEAHSEQARQTIAKQFNYEAFIRTYQQLFNQLSTRVYTRQSK